MFYQVYVKDEHRDLLRFLWWEDGNINGNIVDYEMCVHVFGSTSSPSCSNFALKKTSYDYEARYGTKAAETLRNNFYVDDLLKSVGSKEEAIKLIYDVTKMCQDGGFHLTKFVCNNSWQLSLKKSNGNA